MEKVIDNLRIPILTKEDITKYIESTFSSNTYINIIKKCNDRNLALLFYRNIGKILMSYITSSGDLSKESAIKIMESYYEYISANRKEFRVSEYYVQNVIPLTLEKLGYDNKKLTTNKILEIEKHIALIYNNNRFYTHSFNGALYNNVNNYGLDINHELFNEEFLSLMKLTGQTPFKSGNLFYTELGEHSFQYASKSPEKLGMMLTTDIEHEDDETLEQYYRRCLEKRLSLSTLSESDKSIIKESVNKLLNFYYGQHKSCIAVFKGEDYNNVPDYISTLYTCFLSLRSKIYSLLRDDNELKTKYQIVEESLKKASPDSIKLFDDFKKYFIDKYPNNKSINEMLNKQISYTITNLAIPILTHDGNGDGYVVASGKINRDLISIATIDNIYDLYANKKIEQKQEEKRQQDSLTELKRLLNTDIGDSYYAVDPRRYNGIPYLVKKDISTLIQEEGKMYQKLEQLWFDGVIDLKKKGELRNVIYKEYARLKKKAPKGKKEVIDEDLEKAQRILRAKYGYYEMSEAEKANFDKQLEQVGDEVISELNSGKFSEILESMNLSEMTKENLEQSLFCDELDAEEVEQKPKRIM